MKTRQGVTLAYNSTRWWSRRTVAAEVEQIRAALLINGRPT